MQNQKFLYLCTKTSSIVIAIYGRRRIGKTFLVRQYFKDTFNFYFTGIYQSSKKLDDLFID